MFKHWPFFRLQLICNQEQVHLNNDSLNILIELCEGDLRKSITYLQSLAYTKSDVDPNFIRHMTGRIDDDVVSLEFHFSFVFSQSGCTNNQLKFSSRSILIR